MLEKHLNMESSIGGRQYVQKSCTTMWTMGCDAPCQVDIFCGHLLCIIGHSNGGYATWARAELVTDRNSVIYPAVSEPNFDYLMNLSNMNVRYLTSESDSLNTKVTAYLEDTIKNI